MAESIRRQWSVEKTILAVYRVPVTDEWRLIAVADSRLSTLGTVKQHFEEDLGSSATPVLGDEGGPSEETLRAYVQEVFGIVVQLLPALFILSTAAGALLNYGVMRLLWRRLGQQPPLPDQARTVEGSGSMRLGVDR